MKNTPGFCLHAGLLLAAVCSSSLLAEAPTVGKVHIDSSGRGHGTVLRVTATDPDGDLDFVRLSVATPESDHWQHIGDVVVGGFEATTELPWTPPESGIYTFKATVYDRFDLVERSTASEVFTSQRYIQNRNLADWVTAQFSGGGKLKIVRSSLGDDAQVGLDGPKVFWSGGNAILKQGFSATPGTFFWAAVEQGIDDYLHGDELFPGDTDAFSDTPQAKGSLNHKPSVSHKHAGGVAGRSDLLNAPKGLVKRAAATSSMAGFQLVLALPTGDLGVNPSTLEAERTTAR